MERFYTIKHLYVIMVRCTFKGYGKHIYHNYITLLIFLKSKYLRYKLLPILLPTYKQYIKEYL